MSMNAPEFTRLNDPNTHRNKYINFLSVLKHFDDHDEAMTKLCQLAAQVKPLMKHFGLRINHLEESEYNTEYAGINWNAGESVGLVLRGPSGSFHPLSFVLQVFHHELAHCQFMNHIPSQHGRLTAQLSKECKKLQQSGYYGDGFWSAGTNLKNEISKGDGLGSVLTSRPKELCGGALARRSKKSTKFTGHRKPKPRNGRKQLPGGGRTFKGPSLSSGAQTAANPKSAGNRMKKSLPGQGQRLDGNDHLQGASRANKLYKSDPNSQFGKSVRGQSARERIAEAAERRIQEEKRRLARESRNQEEEEYNDLIDERNQRNRGRFGDEIEISDSETEEGELDEEEEAERSARIRGAVQIEDSDSETDQLETDSDSLEDFLSSIQSSKSKSKGRGKGKGKQKETSKSSRRSSSPSKKTQTQSNQGSVTSRKTPKQLSEISRKAEGRSVGDTWNDYNLGSDDEGSLHFHSEDEEDHGDRFNTLKDSGHKKRKKSIPTASSSNSSESQSSSSPGPYTSSTKRKVVSSPIKKKVSFSKPDRSGLQQSKPSNFSDSTSHVRQQSKSSSSASTSSQVASSKVINLISDEEEEDADSDSGVNVAQTRPQFASSAEEKRWNEVQALRAERSKRQREEEEKNKRRKINESSSALASGSANVDSGTQARPRPRPKARAAVSISDASASGTSEKREMNLKWRCLLCTLNNEWDAPRCVTCDTSRGETVLGA